ncbi:hypothetical protein GE061_008393 [Apolygus lucorum]|uniref:Uncharacterized protein n=1 Tax=Apolygus lucorum TaxID=248454 RepID=A0A6A4J065_APOLU|nr:hypothetical protein GE061_008393 [Apolygus lucorum]
MRALPLLFSLFSLGSCFILVPDDVISLLNAFYSRFPPIRIGMNNTKVGLGFRMGRNVDVQFLVELGPQDSPRPTDSSKREALTAPNVVTTAPIAVNPINLLPSKTTGKPPIVLPFDFISRLRRRRPGITAPTTDRPTSTDVDIRENEIDLGV